MEDTNELLQRANLMLLDNKNITRQHATEYFSKHNLRTGQILEVSTMDLLIEFAKVGLGIGCVIKDFVTEDLSDGSLTELPSLPLFTERVVGFAYQKNAMQSDSVIRFIDFYKGEMQSCGKQTGKDYAGN